MWDLDFVQEKFHSRSPGDYGKTFIKARDSKTMKVLSQKKEQESLGWAALTLWEVREKESLVAGSEDYLLLPIALLIASFMGSFRV